jgi:14-3-3 protein epsilon
MFEYSAYRKGDYYQFLLEFQTNNEKKEAVDQSMKAYEVCESIKKISYLTRS